MGALFKRAVDKRGDKFALRIEAGLPEPDGKDVCLPFLVFARLCVCVSLFLLLFSLLCGGPPRLSLSFFTFTALVGGPSSNPLPLVFSFSQ